MGTGDRSLLYRTTSPAKNQSHRYKTLTLKKPRRTTKKYHLVPTVIRKLPKEKAIKNFKVIINSINKETCDFQPGDNLSGKVLFEVQHSLSVWYVELLIQGQGVVYMHKPGFRHVEMQREIYIKKRALIMGSGKKDHVLHFEPGIYGSDFSYLLSRELPSSLRYNSKKGFGVYINYQVKARICEDTGLVNTRTNTKNQLVKVIKSVKEPFIITRTFDLVSQTDAFVPITHTETLDTSCIPIDTTPASVSFKTDRTAYQLGDKIELHIKVAADGEGYKDNHTKLIKLDLYQNAVIKHAENKTENKKKITSVVSSLSRKVQLRGTFEGNNMTNECDIFFPIPSNILPSLIEGCDFIEVTYSLKVAVKFNKFGGCLEANFPIVIGPTGNLCNTSGKNIPIPVFNRPALMFPSFSPPSQSLTWKNDSDTSITSRNGSIVTTKYYNYISSLLHKF